jgi:hypothetical protein
VRGMDCADVGLRRAYFARLMHVTASLFVDGYDPSEIEERLIGDFGRTATRRVIEKIRIV